ncbi:hypothetical protein JNK13_10955 [bacterium]|nr:hypothetical protein [bacterium]
MTDRLKEIFTGLQERLEGELCGSRTAVAHSGARGEASEQDWINLFKQHLPNRYQADKAFVIDSTGACSDQIDIVIYDRQYSPILYNQAGQQYVPAESVYAVLEAKQDLSREHIIYAGEKAASVRKLKRTSASIPHAGGSYGARPLPRIIGGIVTYQSSWSPPFGQPFKDVLAELDNEHRLDIGCALTAGSFEITYSTDAIIDIAISGQERSLVQFLFRLLKQLQSLATAPAIEYDAYLKQLID